MSRRDIRIDLSAIESIYGHGNFDDAGDDIVMVLGQVTDPASCSCAFEFDTSHPNPWYHVLVFSVDGLDDRAYAAFMAGLTEIFGEDSVH